MIPTETPSIPPPVPPKPPVLGECCERDGDMCLWDYDHEAQRRYEVAVADGQQQQAERQERSINVVLD